MGASPGPFDMSDSDSLSPRIARPDFERIVASVLARRSKPRFLAPLFAPEADWQFNGDPASWTFAGLRSKRDSVLAYLEAFVVEFEQKSLRVLDTLIDGEQACVRYEMELRHRGTGREATLPFLRFIRLEGDLIVEVNEFSDSASLFRLRESGS
jgi:ketosteroid isomerase-like protein